MAQTDFARTLRTAEKLEEKGEIGSSLAWYLKARKLYPASDFAQAGINRGVKEVLPENPATAPSSGEIAARARSRARRAPKVVIPSRADGEDLASVVRRELA